MDWWLRWLHDLARVASGAAAAISRARGSSRRSPGGLPCVPGSRWSVGQGPGPSVRHPLNLRLFLEDVLSDYVDTVGG